MKKFNFLFAPGGGLGDAICSLPILDQIIEHIGPHANIDVMAAKNVGAYKTIIGSRVQHIRTIYVENCNKPVEYQGYMEVNELCRFIIDDKIAFRDDFAAAIPEFISQLKSGLERTAELNAFAKNLPYLNNSLANLAVKRGMTRITLPQWSMGIKDFAMPSLAAPKITLPGLPERYVTFNDGWQANQSYTTKSYDHWQEVIERISDLNCKVIQLGDGRIGNSYKSDINLRGKLNLAESLAVLANSACHIDIEGGLVHAATAMGVPCVVLHGPTNKEFFSYPQNINLTHGTCQNCWWILPNWNAECMATAHTCMKHDPEIIAIKVKQVLTRDINDTKI